MLSTIRSTSARGYKTNRPVATVSARLRSIERGRITRPTEISLRRDWQRSGFEWSLRATTPEEEEMDSSMEMDSFYGGEEEEEEENVAGVKGEEEDIDDPSQMFGEGSQRRSRAGGDGFTEKVIELRRVCATTKGGREVSFRALVVVGNGRGTVGVGNATAKEIKDACRKAVVKARKDSITFFLDNENSSFPHRQEAIFCGAKVMLRPGINGTGVTAGSSVRAVLEAAGVQNGFGKILNSHNLMNNAKATIKALSEMRTLDEILELRDVPLDYFTGKTVDPRESAYPDWDESEIEPWMLPWKEEEPAEAEEVETA